MYKRPSSRGYSILAALVFVALLSGVTFAVQTFSPVSKTLSQVNPSSQSASAHETTPAPSTQAAPTAAKKQVTLKGPPRCSAPMEVKKDKNANAPIDGEGVKNVCVPGCKYTVDEKNVVVEGEDTCASLPTGTQAQRTAKQRCEAERKCEVSIGGKTLSGSSGDQALGRAAGIPSYFKNDKAVLDALATARAGGDPNTELNKLDSWYKDAYEEKKTETQADIDAKLLANKRQQDANLERIERAANFGSNDRVLEGIQKENQALEAERQKLLQERSNLLARETSVLEPVAAPETPKVPGNPITSETTQTNITCQSGRCTANTADAREKDYLEKEENFKCVSTGDTYACSKSSTADTPGRTGAVRCGTAGANPGTCIPTGGTKELKDVTDTFACPTGFTGKRPNCQQVKTDPGCTGANCGPGGPGGPGGGNPGPGGSNPGGGSPGGGSGSLTSALGNFLKGFAQGFGSGSGTKVPCATDPSAYQQQQQQYQQQMQQYNYQLQQYNYQQQQSQFYGGTPPQPPVQPTQCTQTPTSNTCPTPPQQPPASNCANGTWKPVTTAQNNGQQCTSSWQCVPTNVDTTPPVAELSCQPKVVDVGMSVAISFSCSNATGSSGNGFATGGATSGSTTTVIANPPAGANAANFGLTCTNQSRSARAECSVDIAKPTIVLIANPKVVESGAASAIGWITSGMQSCVVSSPQLPGFTAQNANYKTVNGAATTSAITRRTDIILRCATIGGGTRVATTTITVRGDSTADGVSVSSTIDGRTDVRHGTSTVITWQTNNPPANSAVSLWLVDARSGQATALIAGRLGTSGTRTWVLPGANDPCAPDSPSACGADLVVGRLYSIQAALYTPPDAHLGGFPPQNPIEPTYLDQAFGEPFRMSN